MEYNYRVSLGFRLFVGGVAVFILVSLFLSGELEGGSVTFYSVLIILYGLYLPYNNNKIRLDGDVLVIPSVWFRGLEKRIPRSAIKKIKTDIHKPHGEAHTKYIEVAYEQNYTVHTVHIEDWFCPGHDYDNILRWLNNRVLVSKEA